MAAMEYWIAPAVETTHRPKSTEVAAPWLRPMARNDRSARSYRLPLRRTWHDMPESGQSIDSTILVSSLIGNAVALSVTMTSFL